MKEGRKYIGDNITAISDGVDIVLETGFETCPDIELFMSLITLAVLNDFVKEIQDE